MDNLKVSNYKMLVSNTAGGSASFNATVGDYYILMGTGNAGIARASGCTVISGSLIASGSVALVKATSTTITVYASSSWGLSALGCKVYF